MPYRWTTLSKFIIDDQRRAADPQPELTSLLNDIQTACKLIAVAVSRGALFAEKESKPLRNRANDIVLATCEWGGQLSGLMSADMDAPHRIPPMYPRGRYLLLFEPLDGASNIDVNMPVGSIFSVLRCPPGVEHAKVEDFLQPGTAQVAAGYAIYGPVAMMVITLGAGVHGFTLDPEIGAFTLTHANMSIAPATREFAVNMSHERLWDSPVRRYVEECIEGLSGPRAAEFNMRWIASTVGEVHRILLRGGVFMYPSGAKDPRHLLFEANPMAMIVEQAGGRASTGQRRLLDVQPKTSDQHVPMIMGSAQEVERLERYHAEHNRGEDPVFRTPLFNARSLFRSA
jgi:fructose-1,6-bisphosphatase